MSEEAFCTNLHQLGMGIEACLKDNLVRPTLVLLYSAIDIAGWLANDNPQATNTVAFTAWVNDYLLKAKPLNCTALDIYAARCGLVHSLTAEGRAIDRGSARRICYAWGTGTTSALQNTIDRMGHQSVYVAVHLNDLYEAWRLGLAMFKAEIDADPARAARVYGRAALFFSDLSTEFVDRTLELLGE